MTKAQRRKQGQVKNKLGSYGETLALDMIPSGLAMPPRWQGWDIQYFTQKIEVKVAKWSKKYQSFRFKISPSQILFSDFVLLLCLNPAGLLWRGWIIPTDKLETKEITLNGTNLDEYPEYRIA